VACCSAIQRELLRGLATAQPARDSGRLEVDRTALRRALGGRVEIVERMEAKARGRPGANASVMWRYFTTSVYQSGDLPSLATREALQNSADAIRAAVRGRKTRRGEGRFEVTWDEQARSLTWQDNGIGMDTPTILSKFLSLGETGKGGAGSSDEAAGGFGVAKAVILGTSTTFRWELHSRDNLAVSSGADTDVEVFDAPFLQGTRITIFDVDEDFDLVWDYARQEHVPLMDRLHELLGANDLRGITLVLNGVEVKPLFSRRGGSKVRLDGSWGPGTEAQVKAYRRPPGDRQGAYYVRLGGLFQFKESSQRGNLKADVVVDLSTTVRPGQRGYPLNAARDGLQDRARWAFSDLVDEVERENESVCRNLEDEVFDPDSDDAVERDGARQLAELAAEAFADEGFRRALAEATGGIADFYAERVKDPGVQAPTSSKAAAGSRARADGPTRTMVLPDGMEIAATTEPVQAETTTPAEAAGQLRGMLEAAAGVGKDKDAPVTLPAAVEKTLQRAEAGQELDADAIAVLDRAITAGAETALGPAGGGLLQAVAVSQAAHSVLDWLPADEAGQQRRKKRKRNPFGRMAGLRISRRNYDRRRAARFKKGFGKWIPHLTAWDATLRLVAGEARIRRRFKPGFVLDDELLGLASSTGRGTSVVYIHPDRLAQVIKAHKLRPLAIAAYLHGIACHELTHVDGRMGQGHSEEFVSAREDLGHATGHLLPAIAVMVTKVLGLKLKPTEEQKRIGRLERQLEAARSKAKTGKKARTEVSRLEAALEQARSELEAAQAESAAIRTSCCSCPSCAPGAQPVTWATPGTRLRGSTLAEWLGGWQELEDRRASSARHEARRDHLAALPDAVVEQAAEDELDALDAVLREIKPPRGRRAGHATARLHDAIDRRRQQLSRPAPAPDRADRLIDAATTVLRSSPPPGVDLAYLEAFVHRHRARLRGLVTSALSHRTAGAA
jgi:hypothetical protein